jgi:hypothetical protein
MITLIIQRLRFPVLPLLAPITVDLLLRPFYSSTFTLIEAAVPVDVNGNILASPLPSISIDPTQKYVLRAINDTCDVVYDQDLFINPYCPPGYTLSMDDSFCYLNQQVPATPPSAGENTVAETNGAYTNFGAFIYNPGYNPNGTGTSTQINPANPFWINPSDNTTDGPLNRSGVWATTTLSSQTVGFAVCITVNADTTVYAGMGIDNFGVLNLDGNNIVTQDVNALIAQYNPTFPGIGPAVTFKIWHIYPIFLPAGTHVLELIGTNVGGPAAIGCEIYNLTPAQIAAATSYASMGAGLIFSSKDYIGMPVQLGSAGIGYSCPTGYSLAYCQSPIVCTRTLTTPILY